MKIALINHGCAKNLVDSELMLGMLAENGFEITLDDSEAQIVIVNTCSFIHDAETESVQTILQTVQNSKRVIVAGCLAQKHKDELKQAIPEIAAMVGTSDFSRIVEIVKNIAREENYISCVSEKPNYIYPEKAERQQITVGASSYLKIADGCNYRCGYCVIPSLRGAYKSRKIENIVQEAKSMAQKGVAEIALIAQDTTSYGIDLYKKPMLAELLKELNKIDELSWIRVMYAYPSTLNDEFIEAVASLDKVVKYIDIPLQHSHPEILKAMNRPNFDYIELIKKLRKNIPGVTLRTTFIVGYPGETDEHFEHLYNFVKQMRFDRMGVFTYSREKNTVSYNLKPQVPQKIKKQRQKKLMKLQQEISAEINNSFIGKTIPCMIESINSDGLVTARSERDAAEIDGIVYIDTKKSLVPGDIEHVLIKSADDYDLYGEIR